MGLLQTITNLINSKREGDYWDFKQEPHENNASLLHDILCLANSPHKGERYLIFGVSDPSEGCLIKGLVAGQANRKQPVHFIDFLRSKKFAGEVRPEMELKTISIDSNEIDVLVLFDKPHKPYYLTEDYRDRDKVVPAYHIYSRTNDTNTPITKSADIHLIEQMWRQRFGLQLSPLQRMRMLLTRPEEWSKDIGNKKLAYHIQHPEYTITFSEVEYFWEPYTLFYTNDRAFLGTASFCYNSTELFNLEYMRCDEMRITLPVPETEYVRFSDFEQWFYYYDLSELPGLFLHFLTDGNLNLKSRGSHAPLLIFKNDQQRDEFIQQLKKEEKSVLKIKPDFWSQEATKKLTGDKDSVVDILFLSKVYQFYNEFWMSTI